MSKIPKPDFKPGDVIVSDLYMGTITGAFWDDTWNYIIGENASVPLDNKAEGYRMGQKYIRRGDVTMLLVPDGTWIDV